MKLMDERFIWAGVGVGIQYTAATVMPTPYRVTALALILSLLGGAILKDRLHRESTTEIDGQ